MAGLAPIRITVGGIDYTRVAQNIEWTNADPGGSQTANFDIDSPQASRIFPGDKVVIWDGLQAVWVGRVAEPAKAIRPGNFTHRRIAATTTSVSCEGAGAVAKDNKYSMIYLDREMNRWQSSSLQRQLDLGRSGFALGSFQIGASSVALPSVSNTPAIVMMIRDDWTTTLPIVECWYDSGPSNLVAAVYYTFISMGLPGGSVGNAFVITAPSMDENSGHTTSANVYSTVSTSGEFVPATLIGAPVGSSPLCRYACLQYYDGTQNVGTPGGIWDGYWTNIVVLGTHGLTVGGTDGTNVFLYTNQIAQHAAQQCLLSNPGSFSIGQIDALTNYQVLDYKQYDPVEHEQFISDMAKLAPAHYGWWPPQQALADTPEFNFRSYTNSANVFCSLADCNEADISERLGNLFTSVRLTYHDAAGKNYNTTISLPNSVLDRVGIKREVDYDLGLSSSAVAAAYGSFALQALFAQARSAGTITLPRAVRDANGAPVKSHRLRAGLDRIRINDLPVRSALITNADTDSFRISRVDCHLDTSSGQVTTRVELDAGPNLIETLQARLTAATKLAQAG